MASAKATSGASTPNPATASAIAAAQALAAAASDTSQRLQATAAAPLAIPTPIAHHLSLLSRIYVGGIPYEMDESQLRPLFLPFGPLRSISMSIDPTTRRHKGFAFVEYCTPEASNLAMQALGGYDIGGRMLKVGRPNNYPIQLPRGRMPCGFGGCVRIVKLVENGIVKLVENGTGKRVENGTGKLVANGVGKRVSNGVGKL